MIDTIFLLHKRNIKKQPVLLPPMWASLFIASIIQGVFLILLLFVKGTKNLLASRLIATMLLLMVLTNFGYWVAGTSLANYIPWLFGVPWGMMLLFGPLFYLYTKAIIDPSFTWKNKYLLHGIPYLLQLLINLPLFFMSKANWLAFIQLFLSGNLRVGNTEKIVFALQSIHLSIYLLYTFRWARAIEQTPGNGQYILSVSIRLKWVKTLLYCFALFLASVVIMYVFILWHGKYTLASNYTYTLVLSGIIYFIAYNLVLNNDLITPGFNRKYQAYMQFAGDGGEQYINKLQALMTNKIFTNSDLKLAILAEQVGLPPHQLSKLINEKFGRSFSDYINEHRVQEFISRVNDPKYGAYSIYGVALEVGFNSKSSFNTAFKKITGKNPSDYKTSS